MIDLASRVGTRAGRLDRAVVGVQARFAPLFPGGEVQDVGHAIWTMSTTRLLFANGVIRYDATDFQGARSELKLDNCLAALSTYDVPWRFSAWEHLGAEVLVPGLRARGLIEAGSDQAMWLDLPGADRETWGQDGVDVRPATEVRERQMWTQIYLEVFGIGWEYAEIFDQIVAKPHSRSLVAYSNGRPVGCLSMAIEEGLAVVYNVGVLPSARRRGVGTSLLLAAHQGATTRGARACVVVVTRAGTEVCTRLGYRPVTRVTYLMPPPFAS